MKIGLLTLPLLYNYGAILQAYALHRVINEKIGCDCALIDKELPVYPYYRRPLSIISRILARIFRKDKSEIIPYWMSKKTQSIVSSNTRKFVEKYINPKTRLINKLSRRDDKYDVYIVGSDQVWRKSVTLPIENYLFNFVAKDKKKIAYAASLGVDHWEFDEKKTLVIGELMSRFSHITVREESAVTLIHSKLGIKSTQVLDPTMLLAKEDYLSLIKKENIDKTLFSYILDSTLEKKEYVELVARELDLSINEILPKTKLQYFKNPANHVYLSVEEWLQGMVNSQFIVTDSFHGTVFSLIFNKPFIVIPNKRRGNTRLESILNLFDLQCRIINQIDDLKGVIYNPINWGRVNEIMAKERMRCLGILRNMIFN